MRDREALRRGKLGVKVTASGHGEAFTVAKAIAEVRQIWSSLENKLRLTEWQELVDRNRKVGRSSFSARWAYIQQAN